MKSKTYPVAKSVGQSAAKLLGDRKLAKAIYRLAPSNGATFGPAGLLLKQDSDYAREYAARPCLCGRALSFGRLAIFSDGNMAPILVHRGCAYRALQWRHAFEAEMRHEPHGPLGGFLYADEPTAAACVCDHDRADHSSNGCEVCAEHGEACAHTETEDSAAA